MISLWSSIIIRYVYTLLQPANMDKGGQPFHKKSGEQDPIRLPNWSNWLIETMT